MSSRYAGFGTANRDLEDKKIGTGNASPKRKGQVTAMKNVELTVTGAELSDEEIQEYVNRGRENKPSQKLLAVTINADGDYVDLSYTYEDRPFERIRRITGYLVGTLDRFNNAKRAEVLDRVMHDVPDDCEDVYVS